MVQIDFLAANHVHIVRLCKSVKNAKAHRMDIFAIEQLSCSLSLKFLRLTYMLKFCYEFGEFIPAG